MKEQENEQEKFTLLFVITECSATMQDKCYQLHYLMYPVNNFLTLSILHFEDKNLYFFVFFRTINETFLEAIKQYFKVELLESIILNYSWQKGWHFSAEKVFANNNIATDHQFNFIFLLWHLLDKQFQGCIYEQEPSFSYM